MSRRYDYFLLLTLDNPRRVLLWPAAGGWTAPEYEPGPGGWFQLMGREINTVASEKLGLPVTTLEVLMGGRRESNGRIVKAYFLEGHDLAWTPPEGCRWVTLADLDSVELAEPQLKPHLQNWLAGSERVADPAQPPKPGWYHHGWLAEVTIWTRQKLAERSVNLSGRLEQIKTWSISCVLRVPTDAGDYYFKATPQVFAREPYLTAFLAERYPLHFPRITAIEAEPGWMLMPDFNAPNIEDVHDITAWEEVLRQYSRFQIDSLPLTETLLEKGGRDRRLDKLGQQLAEVVADRASLVPNSEFGLTADELARLDALVPVLQAQMAELDAFGLPMAVTHGDLNSRNVACPENEPYIFYDWTDLTISHPFFDLDAFLESDMAFAEEIPNWKERLRNAYLEAWTAYLPKEQLIRAFELTDRLAIMVQALNYHWIVTRIEKSGRWEFESDVPFYFRRLLEYPAAT